jgi:hypothetical protein
VPAGLDQNLVSTVEFTHVPVDRGVDLAEAPPELLTRIALGLGVHGFELAAVDRDEAGVQKIDVAAERDELPADPADRGAIVATESAIVLKSGFKRPSSQISSRLREHSRSSLRDDCTWLR